MAQLMRTSFREADLLVRFGGDEFAVLFADTDEQGRGLPCSISPSRSKTTMRASYTRGR
jgi:GGDEF domain-containing protein